VKRRTTALELPPLPSLTGEAATLAALFDHVPDTAFFVKDRAGRYVAVNRSMAERVGVRDPKEMRGRRAADFYPSNLAVRYTDQDEWVLRTGQPIRDRLEMHWYPRRRPGWCLTTKLPWRDGGGAVVGLVGISRDLRAPGDSEVIPASLAPTLEHLEAHYAEPVSPARLAGLAGLSAVRFARLIKRLFRMTPSQLITQTRLAAASRLLQETEKPIAEVALASGFYDHSAFTRAFRSATGETPTGYRRSVRGG